MNEQMIIYGLLAIVLLVFVLPFAVRRVEENLEAFLFIMGVAACLVSGQMNAELMLEALEEPWKISLAVLAAGAVFYGLREHFSAGMQAVFRHVPVWLVVFVMVLLLGLLSSLITAIVAAIVLVELILLLPMDKAGQAKVCILACFAIGMGAALTPLGEPLSTIAVARLNEDFMYLFRLLGRYIIPSVVCFAAIAGVYSAIYQRRAIRSLKTEAAQAQEEVEPDDVKSIVVRALKVYLFVMALVFLGDGLEPLIEKYVLGMSPTLLYWVNMVSAILDNATLAAAELSPSMSEITQKAILMGLLVSGGMLIPGNIPNIIAASRLKIGATDWAKLGLPLGLIAMGLFYLILFI
ncbi:MAG: DUF1646 family protein [Syntrophomonadaceae bacterium]|nr:DUF1646 family protein [Syntrophomonadaceae bacterium]